MVQFATEALALIAPVIFNVADIDHETGVGVWMLFDELNAHRVAAFIRFAPDHLARHRLGIVQQREQQLARLTRPHGNRTGETNTTMANVAQTTIQRGIRATTQTHGHRG